MAGEEQDRTKQEGKRGRNGEKAMRTTKRTIWRVRKRKRKAPADKARCSQEKGRPGGATRQKEQRGRAAWMA